MVLVERHPLRESQHLQQLDDPVDRGLGDRRDESSAAAKEARRNAADGRIGIRREMFDDGEHRDRIESLVGRVGREQAAHESYACTRLTDRRIGIDADATRDPTTQDVEQRSVGAADVEDARPGRDPGCRHGDPPALENAIESFHASI